MTDAFAQLREDLRPLERFQGTWAVAGGWALDLFLGRVTRVHDDVDVALPRSEFAPLRQALPGWAFERAVQGVRGKLVPLRPGETPRLPDHEVVATHEETGRLLEFLLNESRGPDWVFRRDPRVTLPLARAWLASVSGLPYLAPEIVLLYKAKDPREKHDADFATVAPHLGPEPRAWLREAIGCAHPECGWSV